MTVPLLENLRAGTRFVRENQQVVSTIVIAVVFIASFLFISDRFLNVASSTQERLIEDRIASAIDVFAIFAGEKFDNPADLSTKASLVLKENPTFTSLKVVRAFGQKYEVIASTNPSEVGTTDLENAQWYGFALADPSGQFRIPVLEGSERGYKTVRIITDPNGFPLGAALLEASLASIDVETRSRIRMSYLVLVLIIILVTVLFLRHARIIDYTKLYTELKGVDQMKDDFLSMASHELRTPLTIIRGYADLISSAQRLSEQDKKNVNNINLAADQLNTLVADMLDVSRAEQGRLEFKLEPIATTAYVKELAESFREPAKQKGLNLVVEVPDLPSINVDKDRLRQALINIIGNAVKY
jgi:signal transduction histidine kinase